MLEIATACGTGTLKAVTIQLQLAQGGVFTEWHITDEDAEVICEVLTAAVKKGRAQHEKEAREFRKRNGFAARRRKAGQ
jgi:hypothetical protein